MTKELFKADPVEVAEVIAAIGSDVGQEDLKSAFMSVSDATKLYLMSKGLLLTMINLEFGVDDQEVWDRVSLLELDTIA
jgi:phosphoribosylaminoimidazole-succinocarboxamide synthase